MNTIKAWLSVLEATYQVIVLRPYFANVGKPLVKAPKVYFTDVATLCYLAGLKDPEHAASGPMGGAILETAVLVANRAPRRSATRRRERRVALGKAGGRVVVAIEPPAHLGETPSPKGDSNYDVVARFPTNPADTCASPPSLRNLVRKAG